MDLKKVLLLFIFLAFPNVVFASTYYGEFNESEEECIESDTCKIEGRKKYNTYSLNYIDMGYLDENDEYVKDENDFIKESLDEYIIINTNFEDISEVSFIYMPTRLKIYELEVYYKDEKIEYTPRINYYVQHSENLSDGNLDTYYTHGNDQVFLILYLDKEYKLSDLTIKIYTKSQDNYRVYLDSYPNINLNNDIDRWHIISFVYDINNIRSVNYDYNIQKKYKYYKIEKLIENKYVEYDENENNIILEDYILEDYYYKRDKLVLSDEIKITDNLYSLEDYILFSTDKVNYDCDIDINENGIYYCNFILNDISVKKEVVVDIDILDDINEYTLNEENENIDKLNDNNLMKYIDKELIDNKQIDNKIHNLDVINTQLEQKSDKKVNNNLVDESLKENEKSTNNFIEEYEDNNSNEYIKEENINSKKDNIKSKLIKIIIGLIFIFIDIILIIKRKRDNVESI